MLSSAGTQLEPLRSEGGFEDEEVEVDLRRGGWEVRERVGKWTGRR
jgi:hypothetical protein